MQAIWWNLIWDKPNTNMGGGRWWCSFWCYWAKQLSWFWWLWFIPPTPAALSHSGWNWLLYFTWHLSQIPFLDPLVFCVPLTMDGWRGFFPPSLPFPYGDDSSPNFFSFNWAVSFDKSSSYCTLYWEAPPPKGAFTVLFCRLLHLERLVAENYSHLKTVWFKDFGLVFYFKQSIGGWEKGSVHKWPFSQPRQKIQALPMGFGVNAFVYLIIGHTEMPILQDMCTVHLCVDTTLTGNLIVNEGVH